VRPRLIVTRSLEAIYNVGCVIRAFNVVKTKFPDATLIVVGDGSARWMLEDLCKELDLSAAVTFHGRMNHEKIQDLYDANDIFVNASRVDNMPGTILESWACGLPIVTTNAGGIPYMVTDRVTGLLVAMDDSRCLADRVIELLEKPELAQELSANRRRECRNYTAEHVSNALMPLLRRYAMESKA
jgi:glycosyltransferase involved in cell wall biosynthesis